MWGLCRQVSVTRTGGAGNGRGSRGGLCGGGGGRGVT